MTSYRPSHRQATSINLRLQITNNSPPADARGSSTADVKTYCTFKGKHRNYIRLATAIVEIQNKLGHSVPSRALLVRASQSYLITERCVQNLSLSRTQTHAKIQGISSVNTETYHSVSIHLRSRHTDLRTTITCAIFSHITCTRISTKYDTSTWNIPKDIKLAVEQFD